MINAKQARYNVNHSDNKLSMWLEAIGQKIETKSNEGIYQLRLDQIHIPELIMETHRLTEFQEKIWEALKILGYFVKVRMEENLDSDSDNYFYIVVSW